MEAKASNENKQIKLFWITILYVALLILIITVVSIKIWESLPGPPRIMFVPVYILEWSFVGGMGAVLYRLAYKQGGNTEGIELYTWIVAKPIIGLVMGGLVYLLAVSGLLVLTGSPEIQVNIGLYFLNVLAFIGGFSDRFSIELINQVVSKSLGEQDEKANVREQTHKT